MIFVDTRGRMGNAMFQLAFAHVAARRLGTEFVIGPHHDLYKHFELGPYGRASERLKRRIAYRLRHGNPLANMREIASMDDPGEVLAQLEDGIAYGGFYQSERYFEGYEDEVRALFRVRAEHQRAFARAYGHLGPYVCVHVRRGDHLQWDGGERALPYSYFRDGLAHLGDLGGRPVIIVSDEPDVAAEGLGDVPGATVVRNPAILDFLLIQRASAVVSSNSTFCWWAAWLNEQPGLRVVAPELWLGLPEGHEYPRDAIPPRWEQVPVVQRT